MADSMAEAFKKLGFSAKEEEHTSKEKERTAAQKQEKKNGGDSKGTKQRTGNSHDNASRGHGRARGGNNTPDREPSGNAFSMAYNFVSLPTDILKSPLEDDISGEELRAQKKRNKEEDQAYKRAYRSYIERVGLHSGHIDLRFRTLTPLFIGGFDADKERQGFFSPAGRPIIPGSSLRGMTRSLFKIITLGAMREDEDFTDRRLYFRSMASKNTDFRTYYGKRMLQDERRKVSAEPGFLIRIKETQTYFICPMQGDIETKPKEKYDNGDGSAEPHIEWPPQTDRGTANCVLKWPVKENQPQYCRRYTLVWNKGRRIPVAQDVIDVYRGDIDRFSGEQKSEDREEMFSLLDEAHSLPREEIQAFTGCDDIDFIVPCFYVEKNDQVLHFGHGPYYRIAYKNRIMDQVPQRLRKKFIDFTDAVFGAKEYWSGRVSFEDAVFEGDWKELPPHLTKPLLAPKPTSFQLYLEQKGKDLLLHWDNKTSVRGAKLYWHRAIRERDWWAGPTDPVISGAKEICPLASGAQFSTRLHFENLSDVELGALLKVFYLQEQPCAEGHDIAYKIGRGKSLGMGSIRLEEKKLYIEQPSLSYGSFLSSGALESAAKEEEAAPYIKMFDDYVDERVNKNGIAKQRYHTMMEELVTLLDWGNTGLPGWLQKTSMMSVDNKNFRDRAILPKARDFVASMEEKQKK